MQVRRGKRATIILFKACAFGHQDDVGRSTADLRDPCCCVAQVFNEELI